jgi:uncharacterized membrane protein
MVYKVVVGVAEIAGGVLLLSPANLRGLFQKLAAEERAEDPHDFFVGFMTRHLPAFAQHRLLFGIALLAVGGAKIAAAGAMWVGKEWGRYVLIAEAVLLLPVDLNSAFTDPSAFHLALVALNVAVVAVLIWVVPRWTAPIEIEK